MPHVHRFGRFELRTQERLLLHDGQPRPLGARALDVLIALVEAAGALVTKEQLLQSAWSGLVVEEANVHVQVSHLRKLLGARAIATVAPLGYRFAMPCEGRPGHAAPNSLPAERTRFIGREALLDDAAQRLGQARLVTFTGIGGSGKTRLALRLAAELLGRFPDGVWFVDLAALEDGNQVALALARTLGVAQAADTGTQELLAARVHGSTMLVVLDNCEHLLDAVAELATTLLAASAELRVLATSREALGLAGESVLPVRPLALPLAGAAPALVARAEAVRLFTERAHEALPSFAAEGEALATAAAICRRVDGIPLAIELAAAQLRVLAPAQVLAFLEERFQLLVGSRRSLPRQQTLRAVVRWSWDRLEATEQHLLAALALCSGGCDLAAAAALHDETLAPLALVEGLTRLAAMSMLQVEHTAGTGADKAIARYTMLETVRQYALEQLHGSGEAVALRDRHRDHFLALAEAEERHLMTAAEPGRVIEHLDTERENLLQALAWCRQGGDSRSELRLVVALRHYWGARGLLPLGHELSMAALARAPAAPPSLARCGAQAAAAQLAQWMGRHDEAFALIEQQVAAARALGDDELLGAGLHLQGEQQRARGDLEAATRSLHEACEASRRCGDLRRLGNALGGLATVARQAGRIEEAWQRCLDLLALRRSQPHRYGVGVAVLNCASMAVERGQAGVARPYLAEGLQIGQQVCSRHLTQAVVTLTSEWAALVGDVALATRLNVADGAQRQLLQMPLDADGARHQAGQLEDGRRTLGEAQCTAEIEAGNQATHDETLAWVGAAVGAWAAPTEAAS
ncbi:MAG: winged helix-turn-helix domain-containing protein [Rubrivivax sp.]|nr:winged helix-turn-helix domain-containing protein [Rubrivivax sp.]